MENLDLLSRLSAKLGVELDAEARGRLIELRRLLLEWNQRFNLTRITDPNEIELKLFLDALALLPWIRRQAEQAQRTEPPRLVDIGAGAGFPGLPLKIADPGMTAVLVEATGKKATFIRAAAEALGLNGLTVLHGRAEVLAHQPELRGRFDIVTARAVARLPTLLELCQPFCRRGGWGLFPKGRGAEEEVRDAKTALRLLNASVIAVAPPPLPELEGSWLVVVEQGAPAPPQYPRRTGVPGKMPL